MEPLIYQPSNERKYRVTWYGNKAVLHFEKYCLVATPNFDGTHEWVDIDVRTVMGGLPSSAKELYQEMEDYYNYGIIQEQERIYAML
jgi:hypothetical protein